MLITFPGTHPEIPVLGYIALGGVLGTVARFGLQGWVQGRVGAGTFPLGTVAVNLTGSFLLGFLMRYTTATVLVSPELRAGLTIGFCGAFTTMSTFAWESQTLLGGGSYWQAALYAGTTILGSLLAVLAGLFLANQLL